MRWSSNLHFSERSRHGTSYRRRNVQRRHRCLPQKGVLLKGSDVLCILIGSASEGLYLWVALDVMLERLKPAGNNLCNYRKALVGIT